MPRTTTHTALAAAIVLLVAATDAALFVLPAPLPMRDIVNVVVGVIIAKFGTVYDYYFGSSKAADRPADQSQAG